MVFFIVADLGFPVRRGRVELKRDVSWADTACELVTFPPFSFYPDKQVHVQITTNHWNSTRKNFVHEATVSWVENVNYQNFKASNDKMTKKNIDNVNVISDLLSNSLTKLERNKKIIKNTLFLFLLEHF